MLRCVALTSVTITAVSAARCFVARSCWVTSLRLAVHSALKSSWCANSGEGEDADVREACGPISVSDEIGDEVILSGIMVNELFVSESEIVGGS